MKKIFLFLLLTATSFNAQAELIHKSINAHSPEFQTELTDKDTLLVNYSLEHQRTRYPWYYELQCTSDHNNTTIEYTLGGYPLKDVLPASFSELAYGSKHGKHLETYGQFTITSTQLKSHVQCQLVYRRDDAE